MNFEREKPIAKSNAATPLKTAAMYVRMSTDHQKYSTENQADAIKEYAARRNIEIIQTYEDAGKSGLRMDGREALQRLIFDVQNGNAKFNMILVLDVTRWGRFQDADESAYYEYICRRAGLDVQYVAEQFTNDGSLSSTIIKSMKRSMAGEYSRELSGKVFAGQCRLIEMGYRQGGPAGYGLRRILVDEHGNFKSELRRGEHKSFQTDRVILMPGPDEEVENVRWIYQCFIQKGLQESQIAALLNQRGVLTDLQRPWTRATVHQILTNEKYIGNNVFNRISYKLKIRRVINEPDMWVRKDGVFEAIVDPAEFFTAQGIIRERSRRMSDGEMLDRLKQLHERQGWLSGFIINEADNMPSSTAYTYRFGSLIKAYKMIGYTPDRDFRYVEINRHLRQLHAAAVQNTIEKIKALGGTVRQEEETELLIINESLKVSMVVGRCKQTMNGGANWRIMLDTGLEPDITVAIRMDRQNEKAQDYYLLPALDIEFPKIRLTESNGLALDAYRFDDLQPFYRMTELAYIQGAA